MEDKDIVELMYLVESCKNNLSPKFNHMFDDIVEDKCTGYCKSHNIKIVHGSAFKELRHKSYYYKDKNIESIINKGVDLYGLMKHHITTDKDIVDKLFKMRRKEHKQNNKI